jgi:SAM-dependent methyltransferase
MMQWLAHPLTRGMDLDSPQTTKLRQRIVAEKKFLRRIYEEWYSLLLKEATARSAVGPLLELGSGAGFLGKFSHKVITSEVFYIDGVKLVMDGQALPFANQSLKGILMVNVLHHINQPRRFLSEASRCIKPDGLVAMIEPWLSAWSRLVYRNLHHEPIDEATKEWRIPEAGPLSGANSAMPWIIFCRDRSKLTAEYPQWRLAKVRPIMPLRYLLAGGISMRSLMPGFTFTLWKTFESLLSPMRNQLGMFAEIIMIHEDNQGDIS